MERQLQEQKQMIEKLIKQCDKNNENDRRQLKIMWRETTDEVKNSLDSNIYNRLIEIMENDPKGLATIWRLTPEHIQTREMHLLDKILECTIDDTKRYISIWENTSPQIKEQYKEVEHKLNMLNQLQARNSKIIDTINLRILDSKYTSSFSMEQLQMITCYTEEQKKVIDLIEIQYNTMMQALSNVKDIQQWRYEFNEVLSNISSFEDLIENVAELESGENANIDYYKVLMVLHQKNHFNVKSYKDVEELDKTKADLYENIKNKDEEQQGVGQELSLTKFVVLEHLYNINIDAAKRIIQTYGKDIFELSDNPENAELKDIIMKIQSILDAQNESELKALLQTDQYVKVDTDNIKLEMSLKNAYAQEYNDKLTNVSDMRIIPEEEKGTIGLSGCDVYDAGVDFNLMITSIAPYNSNNPKDFCQDWNRKEMQSQGFCCSYIRNDMLGHAPVPHLCYGFSNMGKDSLILSSIDDMGSNTSNGIIEETAYSNVRFYAPNNQIDRVYDESTYNFNEMVYNRIQNGAKKQPDYIVALKRDGTIDNVEKIRMAVEQYRAMGIEIPVVVIDESKCIECEKEKIKGMIEIFEANPNPELFAQIQQKVKNNSVANQFEFEEFANYLYNEYEEMKNVLLNKKDNTAIQEKSVSNWMQRFKNWYEFPDKLPDKTKHVFLEMKNKIVQVIKSRTMDNEKTEQVNDTKVGFDK